MSSRFAGRALVIASIAGLGAAALADGPSWLIIGFLGLAAIGLLLIGLAPAPPRFLGLDELRAAADALDSATGVSPASGGTPDTPRAVVELVSRRIRDAITRIRAGADEAAQRRRTLETLFDRIDEPILATDELGRILVCNAPAQELLGLRADRLVGRPVEEAFTQPDFVAIIQSARAGTPTREEVRVPRPEGPRIWETAAVPYGPAGPQMAVVLTLHDVTERALALQVKTDFVANASHELRTPVSAIRMAVETLEGLGPGDQAMWRKLLAMIASHTQRLEELIRDLLDLTRLESTDDRPNARPVPPAMLMADLAPMFEGVCRERHLSLRFDFSTELESLHTDRNLLLLILGNLVDNSCKFAFEGTEVVISGRPGQEARSAVFEVIDQGVGIPLGQQQRIFERFFQVDAARTGGPKRGTGLGLAIVKHAVRRLGGSIRVHSVWQRGTTMTVELPSCLDGESGESRDIAIAQADSPHPRGRSAGG